MELNEMKLAWQAVNARMERRHALDLQLFRDRKLDKLQLGLRPLVWGQAIQMLVGALGLLLLAPMWMPHWRDPAMLASGVVVHLYCIGLIVVGGLVQSNIAGINYGAPVLDIQRRLLRLRRVYAVGGALAVGLPWWFMTAPLLVVLTRGAIMQRAPEVIWIQLAIGAAGLLATGWFHRWTHRPQRAEFARKVDDSAAGGSIRRAQATLDEIARFERE